MAWVSVTDRLPERYELVLAYSHGDKVEVASWSKHPNHGDEIIWHGEDSEIMDVTHWMHLPKRPEGPLPAGQHN